MGDWSIIYQARWDILSGLVVTLQLVAIALVIGIVGGSLLCVSRLQHFAPLRVTAAFFVNAFRALPETILIFWIYFCGPFFFKTSPSAWTCGILAMSLVSMAYFSEIVRAGIEAIDRGQWEAARSIGLSELDVWVQVIVPQAFRVAVPALALLVTQLVKMSGLTSAIGVTELVYQAQTLGSLGFRYMEFFSTVAVIYFCIIFPFSVVARLYQASKNSVEG